MPLTWKSLIQGSCLFSHDSQLLLRIFPDKAPLVHYNNFIILLFEEEGDMLSSLGHIKLN